MCFFKKYKHAPAHLFVDDTCYFFTGAVYQKKRLLHTAEAKRLFVKYLFHFVEKYRYELFEWVVLDNHYHLLINVTRSKEMPQFINSLHKTSAFHIQKILNEKFKPFWYQYWDQCIRNEKHYFETANYILCNPIKHGYANDLNEYKFSSFHIRKKQDLDRIKKDFMDYRPEKIDYYNAVDDF